MLFVAPDSYVYADPGIMCICRFRCRSRRDLHVQGRLMAPPNVTWQSIIQQAMVSADVLKQSEVVRNVQNILQTNVSVCSSLGAPFLSQMRIIYVDMLTMYKCDWDCPPAVLTLSESFSR